MSTITTGFSYGSKHINNNNTIASMHAQAHIVRNCVIYNSITCPYSMLASAVCQQFAQQAKKLICHGSVNATISYEPVFKLRRSYYCLFYPSKAENKAAVTSK